MYDNDSKKGPKIYVSNLDVSASEYDLRRFFEKFGNITDVVVKQKDTISFAFIEFDSVDSAEKAIQGSNGHDFGGRQMKVYFARGGNERRGGFNDRGRGRSGGYGDGPPRRDFGDRPKGCFNCAKEGHMARDCPEPRKPREGGFERRPYDGGDRRGGDRGDRYEGRGRQDREYRGGRDNEERRGYPPREGGFRGGDRRDRGRHEDRRDRHERKRRSNSSSRSRGSRGKGGRVERSPSSGSR